MIDEGEVLAGEVAIGGEVPVLVILAAGHAELERLRRGPGRRQRPRPAVDAVFAPGLEPVPVRPIRLEAGQVDVHAVAELRAGELLAAADDRIEAGIRRDLVFHRHRRHRHAALGLERLGRETGPDDEAVGRWLAGGDAKAERIGPPDRLGAQDGRGGDGRNRGAGDELTTSQHAEAVAPRCCDWESP
jgi:hypothetical protein